MSCLIMEFSIAMLESGGWTNKEIGEHMGISINTVKHYLTDIFCKLDVKKRDELKKFMLNYVQRHFFVAKWALRNNW